MKLKHIFSLLAGVLLMFASCSPDDYSMGGAQYSSEDLVIDKAYTVTINGNLVTLKSLVSGYTPLWITPNGRSQEEELTIELPFAGTYEVTFGVDTRAGAVYGDPHTFTLAQNDFSLLEDSKYFYLAYDAFDTGDAIPDAETLSAGVSKKWVPLNKDYGVGQTVGPMTFCNPDDVLNNGTASTDLAFEAWTPNYDPGFTNWLITEDDPYLDSEMTFGLSAADGCTVTVKRVSADGTTTMNGKYQLALSDKTHPTISFSDAQLLHHAGYDDACSNWTQELKIVELTPYLLQIAVYRDSDPWWAVYSYVSQEVIDTDGECIPKEQVLETPAAVRLPEFSDLATQLYTTDINGVTFVGNELTYVIDEDAPYEFMWWNGAPYNTDGTQGLWTNVINGNYGSNWAPSADESFADFELTLGHKSVTFSDDTEGTILTWNDGNNSGMFTIGSKGQTLTFTDYCTNSDGDVILDDYKPTDINFITASSDLRTISIKGSEFVVLACDPGSTLTLGLPESYDEDGNCNLYRVVNLKPKEIASSTGPTVVSLSTDYASAVGTSDDGTTAVRLRLWNSYGSGGLFTDPDKVKLKKGQTLTLSFKLTGITWTATPKCALFDNGVLTSSSWESGGYDSGVTVNTTDGGTTTISITNTGSTVSWASNALELSIQWAGYSDNTIDDFKNAFSDVTCTIQ